MRIAHGQSIDFNHFFVYGQFVKRLTLTCHKGDAIRLEYRRTHVDGDFAIGLKRGLNHTRRRAHTDARLLRQPFVVHEAHKAACAVTALLHLTAIGVIDAVIKIGVRRQRRFHL